MTHIVTKPEPLHENQKRIMEMILFLSSFHLDSLRHAIQNLHVKLSHMVPGETDFLSQVVWQ